MTFRISYKFTSLSEFNEWYKREIEGINELVNDLKTYREIFEKMENVYFNGKHKNTEEKRSRDNPSFVDSWTKSYLRFLNKFPNWDKYPEWKDFQLVMDSILQLVVV